MTTAKRPLRVAIMQPYLFPYLGYFQLIAAADEFWLLDDVQFIQRGWMHRNRLRINQDEWLFTIPVNKHPRPDIISNKTFADTASMALNKLSKTMTNSYKNAPHLNAATDLIAATADQIEGVDGLASFTDVTSFALEKVCVALKLDRPIHRTSNLSLAADLTGQSRIVAACQAIGATSYVNMIGGKDLYDAETFAAAGISLSFLTPILPPYDQGTSTFLAGLSILDVMANLPVEDISSMLYVSDPIVA